MSAKTLVKIPEIIDPKLGIKFITKAKNAHTTGKSSPIRSVPAYTIIPVNNEI
jgi:hypothetical protein